MVTLLSMEKAQAQQARDIEMQIAGMNIAWGIYTQHYPVKFKTVVAAEFAADIEARIKQLRGGSLEATPNPPPPEL